MMLSLAYDVIEKGPTMAYGWPVDLNTPVTQIFGTNINSVQPDGHTGMDFGCAEGSPVYAIGDGVVRLADWSDVLEPNNAYGLATTAWLGRSAGIVVIIDHGDIVSISAHLSSTDLNTGQTVKRGQLIGKSGSTGYSFGAHLHFEILPDGWNWRTQRWYGRVNPLDYITKTVAAPPAPVPAAITATQRVTGDAGVKYRPEPNTSKAETATYNPGDVLNFVGFVHGENVSGNDVWFKGIGGGFVWSGGLTNSSTNGLSDLTPKPAPTPVTPATSSRQRVVGPSGVNYRKEAKSDGELIKAFSGGDILDFKGFIRGEVVNGNGIWFIGAYTGGYAWSGGFTSQATTDLPDLTPIIATPSKPPVTPTPPVTPAPVVVPPVSTPVGKPVDNSKVVSPDGLKTVTEWIPAHSDNFQVGNFPAIPEGEVIHQFGVLGIGINSVISYFQMGMDARIAGIRKSTTMTEAQKEVALKSVGPTSAHFAVEDDRIVQMVSIKNRAYHAGKFGNGYIGIETSPNQSPKTIASVNRLLDELYSLGVKPRLWLHKNIPDNATECGSLINLANYHSSLPSPVVMPAPVVPTTTSGSVTLPANSVALIEKYLQDIDKILKDNKK